MDGTILVADDDRTIRTVLTQALTRAGCKVHATSTLATLVRWVEEGKGDLVISDVVMPDGNGLEVLPHIAATRPGLPVIVISAQNTIMTAIKAAERDAFDYLPKPFDLPDLMRRAARALDQRRERRRDGPVDGEPVAPTASGDLPLVGQTPRMQELYRTLARVMNVDLPVMVLGESGTGKSLIARAIHDFSDRRTLPFVAVSDRDLATPESVDDLVRRARGGSVVFEEVGDLSPEAQRVAVRLLDGIGEGGPRVLSTTQRPLSASIGTSGGLRADLHWRLSGTMLALPPLRERVADIALLASHFLVRAERDGGAQRRLAPAAAAAMRTYPWPGNVRQLENVVRQLVATGTAEEIGRGEIEAVLDDHGAPVPEDDTQTGDLSDIVGRHLRRHFDLQNGRLPAAGLHARVLRDVERPLIEIALDATAGNQAKCADLLGINRNTLRKKITDLEISVTRRRRLM